MDGQWVCSGGSSSHLATHDKSSAKNDGDRGYLSHVSQSFSALSMCSLVGVGDYHPHFNLINF